MDSRERASDARTWAVQWLGEPWVFSEGVLCIYDDGFVAASNADLAEAVRVKYHTLGKPFVHISPLMQALFFEGSIPFIEAVREVVDDG